MDTLPDSPGDRPHLPVVPPLPDQPQAPALQAVPSAPGDQPVPQAPICKKCGVKPAQRGYAAPICAPCRAEMVRRPFPLWIICSAVVVAFAVIAAFVNFPGSLSAGIAYERGKRFDSQGNYVAAEREFRHVVDRFPNSVEPMARYAIASFHAGDGQTLAHALDRLEGKQMDHNLADQLQEIVRQLKDASQGTAGQSEAPSSVGGGQ